MATKQEIWDQSVKKHNAALIEEATKSHAILQETAKKLQEISRWMLDQYPMASDGTIPSPATITETSARLRTIARELEKQKEQVPLLGQAQTAFKIDLPEWAELKNP